MCKETECTYEGTEASEGNQLRVIQSVSAQIDFILDPINFLLDFGGQALHTGLAQPFGKAADLLLCSLAKPLLQLLNASVQICDRP